MTPRELINLLMQCPNLDSDLEVRMCLTNADSDVTDIPAILEVHGLQSMVEGDSPFTMIVIPKDKRDSTSDFETLYEILKEGNSKVTIEFDNAGTYIFSNGELRREMEFKKDFNGDIPSEYIKKLIYEL